MSHVVSSGLPFASFSRHRPIQSKFSSAKPIGSIKLVAGGASRIGAMLFQLFANAELFEFAGRGRAAAHLGGGGGTGVPSKVSSTHAPRKTGLVCA